MENKKKTFILDTNVILHDFNCLLGFDENNIGIPITVLEEIDNFKKGRDQLNFNAREFSRQIDELTGGENEARKDLFKKGIELGEGKGKLFVITDVKFKEEFLSTFVQHKEDHYILSGCYNYIKNHPEEMVVFVSKDVNLRIKARALGIEASDYQRDKIKNVKELTTVVKTIENAPDELINQLYQKKNIPEKQYREFIDEVNTPNKYLIIKNQSKSALCRYDSFEDKYSLVEKKTTFGINPRNSEQTFAIDALMDDRIKLVTITGRAGTGKTLLALASSLQCRKKFKQIFLARPIVPLSNKDIGYLPGTAKSKIEPYMQPLYDNLKFIQNNYREGSEHYQVIEEYQKYEKLLISPLAYIRGRTLSNIFFIVDEAQNLSPHEVKTIITRAGEGTKIVFTGDINQIDTPFLDTESNGLTYIIDKFKNQDIYAHMTLRKGERSELSELASKLL